VGKIMSYSFKKADDPFFRTSFKVFTPNKFGQSAIIPESKKGGIVQTRQQSGSSNNLKSDT
jgi:hypothetical protein